MLCKFRIWKKWIECDQMYWQRLIIPVFWLKRKSSVYYLTVIQVFEICFMKLLVGCGWINWFGWLNLFTNIICAIFFHWLKQFRSYRQDEAKQVKGTPRVTQLETNNNSFSLVSNRIFLQRSNFHAFNGLTLFSRLKMGDRFKPIWCWQP